MTDAVAAAPAVTECLVCVYYRVAASGQHAVIAAVRDIQRGITAREPGVSAELLLRSAHLSTGGGDIPPPAGSSPPTTADPTLMETYRLDARPAGPRLDAFLAMLSGRMQALAPHLRGERHVEVFLPCAS